VVTGRLTCGQPGDHQPFPQVITKREDLTLKLQVRAWYVWTRACSRRFDAVTWRTPGFAGRRSVSPTRQLASFSVLARWIEECAVEECQVTQPEAAAEAVTELREATEHRQANAKSPPPRNVKGTGSALRCQLVNKRHTRWHR
jgi:hypothetical protein